MERIVNTELGVIREPLRAPFGFKGGTLSELWQTAVRLTLDSGASGMGVGVQSVLWSDPVTFCACDEAGGNERMLAVTRRALELLQGQAFTDPPGMTAGLVPELLAFARRLLGRADVPQTFVLNALVPVDFALWQLWNAKRGNGTFDALCASFCPELTNREKELGSIPLITYHTPEDELHALLEDGAFLLKVKIGSDPEKNGDPEAMLAWDIGRLRTVHTAAAGFTTPYTECGRPVYYLDANGRYPDREFLLRFLDAADKMDALERIVLLEEPFAGDRPEPVHGLPVRVAGAESAHSAQDVARLTWEYGYSAIACKPIAKTLSVTLEMGRAAQKSGAACFCADLTVPPALWTGICLWRRGCRVYRACAWVLWRATARRIIPIGAVWTLCAPRPEPPGAHRRTACTGLTEVFMGKAAFLRRCPLMRTRCARFEQEGRARKGMLNLWI